MGHAVFQSKENGLKLLSSEKENLKVNGSWIRRTNHIVEGLLNQPYLHLDINTPFGDTVTDTQVAAALAESLGPKAENYLLSGWHIQFVEDTNLGSNHRIFVDLVANESTVKIQAGMDMALNLEIAASALGDIILTEKSEATFQFFCSGIDSSYSLLFFNGSPLHVLRIKGSDEEKVSRRILSHREFLCVHGKMAANAFPIFVPNNDLGLEMEAIQNLKPQTVSLGQNQYFPYFAFHVGLARASLQKEFVSHNRVANTNTYTNLKPTFSTNDTLRSQFQFIQSMIAMGVFCLIIFLSVGSYIILLKNKINILQKSSETFTTQVKEIHALRKEKNSLELYLNEVKVLWHAAIDWKTIFSGIAKSLPLAAGLDGVTVNKQLSGETELSFRAWVKDWDQVQKIQKSLLATHQFKTVSLSEQKKDLASGVVVFHISCVLKKH